MLSNIHLKKGIFYPWSCGSVGWSNIPRSKKVAGSIPNQGTHRKQPINLSLSTLLSLKSTNISSGEDLKNCIFYFNIIGTPKQQKYSDEK